MAKLQKYRLSAMLNLLDYIEAPDNHHHNLPVLLQTAVVLVKSDPKTIANIFLTTQRPASEFGIDCFAYADTLSLLLPPEIKEWTMETGATALLWSAFAAVSLKDQVELDVMQMLWTDALAVLQFIKSWTKEVTND